MKKRSIHIAAVIASALILPQIASISVYAGSSPALPPSNTQPRHVDCTSLSEQAEKYYMGEYSIDNLMELSGAEDNSTSLAAMQDNALFDSLHSLMNDTQTFYPSYSGYKEGSLAYYWNKTDAVESSADFVSFYSDILYGYNTPEGKKFNMEREHIWPKSNASYHQIKGGADLHHLRPSVSEVNQAKSNFAFGNVNGFYPLDAEEVSFNDTLYAWVNKSADLFECKDDVKGDAARILLYVYCRWEQPNLYSDIDIASLPEFDSDDDTNNGRAAVESLDTLLEWIEDDPVDTWEMERNDLTEQVQGNRNVFIDYPELAWKMFGKEVPEHIQTPAHSGCHHDYAVTELKSSDCLNEGSITKTCNNCGETRTYQIQPDTHRDADGDHFCDGCGERYSHSAQFSLTQDITEGKHLMLVCKADEKTPANNLKSGKFPMMPSDVSDGSGFADVDTAVFYTESAENGFYLKSNGKYLADNKNGSLSYVGSPTEKSVWQFEKNDDGTFFITCVNSLYTDKNTGETAPRMLESYKDSLSLYYTAEPGDIFKFYVCSADSHISYEEIAADCTENKSADCKCELCGESFTKEIPAKGHTDGKAVTENKTEDGYDTVIYCTDCGSELSRVHTDTETTKNETEQIAPDDILLEWAAAEYQDKTGKTVTASADGKENGSLTISLTDENGVRADTYVIDTATGIGTDSDDRTVDLPQTGIYVLPHIIIETAALFMLFAGCIALFWCSARRNSKGKDSE